MILLIYNVLVAGRNVLVIDDVLYVLQARLFGHANFSLPIDPSVIRFFMLRQATYVRDGMFSLYSPGWPTILALFDAVGSIRWAGAILGAVTVALTYILGLRVHSARVGAIGAGLLVLHPVFLHRGNLYSSHSGSALFLMLVAILAVGDKPAAKIQVWRWLAIGLSLGLAFSMRPLTGVAVGCRLRSGISFARGRRCHESLSLRHHDRRRDSSARGNGLLQYDDDRQSDEFRIPDCDAWSTRHRVRAAGLCDIRGDRRST